MARPSTTLRSDESERVRTRVKVEFAVRRAMWGRRRGESNGTSSGWRSVGLQHRAKPDAKRVDENETAPLLAPPNRA